MDLIVDDIATRMGKPFAELFSQAHNSAVLGHPTSELVAALGQNGQCLVEFQFHFDPDGTFYCWVCFMLEEEALYEAYDRMLLSFELAEEDFAFDEALAAMVDMFGLQMSDEATADPDGKVFYEFTSAWEREPGKAEMIWNGKEETEDTGRA